MIPWVSFAIVVILDCSISRISHLPSLQSCSPHINTTHKNGSASVPDGNAHGDGETSVEGVQQELGSGVSLPQSHVGLGLEELLVLDDVVLG